MRVIFKKLKTKDNEVKRKFEKLLNQPGEIVYTTNCGIDFESNLVFIDVVFKPFDPLKGSEVIRLSKIKTSKKSFKLVSRYLNEFVFEKLEN